MVHGEANLDHRLEREAIRDLICQTAILLDDEDFDGWLALFAAEAEYELTAYSGELRAEMSWWKSNRDELANVLRDVHQHVRDPARRLHLVSPMRIEIDGDRATATSNFSVYRTLPSGESRLYVVGRYQDALIRSDGYWRYRVHCAVLDTRVLDIFTHVPL